MIENSTPTLTDSRFREIYGVTSKTTAALRASILQPDIDYQKKGGAFHYTPEAVKKMAEALGVSELPGETVPPPPDPVAFEVTRICRNPGIVEARPVNPFGVPAEEPLTENQLLQLTGMERKVLAAMRHHRLAEGEGWTREGGEVFYTPQGRRVMRDALWPAIRIRVPKSHKLKPRAILQAVPVDADNGLWTLHGKLPKAARTR
jgi:hypothetical protein